MYNRSVKEREAAAVQITTGEGIAYTYIKPGSVWIPPAGAQNSLQQTSSGWTETQPDGLAYQYAPAGGLQYIKLPAGGRYTMTSAAVISPVGRRLSFSFDASGNLRRIQDGGSRNTTFSVNTAGNLQRVTTPDTAIATLAYDASHKLLAHIDPLRVRVSLGYDSSSRVIKTITPQGERYSYLYGTYLSASGDPRGLRTTWSYYPVAC